MRALRVGVIAAASALGLALLSSDPATSAANADGLSVNEVELPRGCFQPAFEPSAPVPPLVQCDRAGRDQDEVFSVGGDDVFYELPDGSGVDSKPRSVNGAASVPYTTGYVDDRGYPHEGPSYVATFNDTGVSGVDAKNGYVARVSPRCQDGLRKVDFDFVNEPDSRYRMVNEANLFIDDNLRGVFVNRVLDGETVYMGSLMAGSGRRVVRMEQDGRRITGLPEFVVPSCGGGTTTPRGSLTQVPRMLKIKATLDNRSDRRTAYRLEVDPLRGSGVTKSYFVGAHQKKTVTYGDPAKAKSGTRYTLQAQVMQGQRLVWKTLATKTAR